MRLFHRATGMSLLAVSLSACTGREPAAPPPAAVEHVLMLPVRQEPPYGYPDDPAALQTPLRQDLSELRIATGPEGRSELLLGRGESALSLSGIDLRPFVPRVPRLALGDPVLTRIALVQRELNRQETRYPAPGGGELRLANNCLRQGLWEVALTHTDGSQAHNRYHGWFNFPKDEYARLFEEVNGLRYADYEKLLTEYPQLGGLPVPLPALRTVLREGPAQPVRFHGEEPVRRLPEQERKAPLLLSPGMQTYGDFTVEGKQPVCTAKFTEPGYYDAADPMRFDLRWLAGPVRLVFRRVENPRVGQPLDEVQIDFRNGYRLLLGAAGLAEKLPARHDPQALDDVLRLTFGIGTPEISESAADRRREFAEDPPGYLLLLDEHGRYVDNHAAGLDQVYLWCDAGQPATLHLLMVGYERIALWGHLSAPYAPVPE